MPKKVAPLKKIVMPESMPVWNEAAFEGKTEMEKDTAKINF